MPIYCAGISFLLSKKIDRREVFLLSVIESLKEVLDTAKKISNLELQKQIIDIQSEIQELQNENWELKKSNDELTKRLKEEKTMSHDKDENVYFHEEPGREKDGPFCPYCWEDHRKQGRLYPFKLDLKCNICGKVVGDKNVEESNRKNKEEMDNFLKY